MISKGCEQCAAGGKLVVFVHGFCDERDCFYCPLGDTRKNVSQSFANERPIQSTEDLLTEARVMDALGASITGGEPQEEIDLTCEYINGLKKEFGNEFHIHLYTGITGDRSSMRRLAKAGLDEIRFHPPIDRWGNLHGTEWEDILYIAADEGITPAFEIPGIKPEPEFIEFLDEGAAAFCNINEFEISDGNYERMHEHGYAREPEHMSAVEGSKSDALFQQMVSHPKVYFCTSVFKDAAQHRRRLKRMAETIQRDFDDITDDGTIVYGKTWTTPGKLEQLGVPDEFYTVKQDHIEIAWWLLEEMIREGDIRRGEIVEQYPTYDGTVVERTPLA